MRSRRPSHLYACSVWRVSLNSKQIPFARLLMQSVSTIGRSSLSLIQLTNSSPGQRPQNHMPMAATQQNNMTGNRGPRPLDQVTCYKVSRSIICLCAVFLSPVSRCSRGYEGGCGSLFTAVVWSFEKYIHALSCWKSDEKINSTHLWYFQVLFVVVFFFPISLVFSSRIYDLESGSFPKRPDKKGSWIT